MWILIVFFSLAYFQFNLLALFGAWPWAVQ